MFVPIKLYFNVLTKQRQQKFCELKNYYSKFYGQAFYASFKLTKARLFAITWCISFHHCHSLYKPLSFLIAHKV